MSSLTAQPLTYPWAKSGGGGGNEAGSAVATDNIGNVFMTGSYTSPTITFGSTTLYNAGGIDFFLVKYDAAGNVLWAVGAGGTANEGGYSLVTDGSGNVIVCGSYTSSSLVFGSETLVNAGLADIFLVKYSSSGSLVWAESYGSSQWEEAYSLATNTSGSLFITGYYTSTSLSFGNNTITHSAPGTSDIFVVKLNQNANVQWAKTVGGTGNEAAYGIAADNNGNCYITGGFNSPTLAFGSFTLVHQGNGDIFMAKYNTFGNVQWGRQAGGASSEEGVAIASDANGNLAITGYFYSSTLSFGTTVLNNAAAGSTDIFLAYYSTAGMLVWAAKAGGSGYESGYSVRIAANGNILLSGAFTSPVLAFGPYQLTQAGASDVFVVQYNSGGNPLWAARAGAGGDDEGYGLAVDGNGNVWVTGYFNSDTLLVGSNTLINKTTGWNDVFLAGYSPAGAAVWAGSTGGYGYEWVSGIRTDASGNVYMSGGFSSPAIVREGISVTNSGGNDIFLIKTDSAGNVLWSRQAGGPGNDAAYALTCDPAGNVYLAGAFSGSYCVFGTDTLFTAGYSDAFVVKYAPDGSLGWVRQVGGSGYEEFYDIATDSLGFVYLTGYFDGASLQVGPYTLLNNNAATTDVVSAKYDASGNVIWAARAGGSDYDAGYALAVTADGTLYVGGSFTSPSLPFGSQSLNHAGNGDIFLIQYLQGGGEGYALKAGGAAADEAYAVSTGPSGQVALGGYFMSDSVTWGANTLYNTLPGSSDGFLVTLDAMGQVQWARKFGGTGYETGYGLCYGPGGQLFLTGSFGSPSMIMGQDTLLQQGIADIFMAGFHGNGDSAWAVGLGGTATDEGYDVYVDEQGHLFAGGYFSSPQMVVGANNVFNTGGIDMVAFRMDPEYLYVEGNVYYGDSLSHPLSQVSVFLVKDNQVMAQVITDTSGHFEFSYLSPGTYNLFCQCSLPWGGVNASDALLIMKSFVGITPLHGMRLQAAELTGEGAVNAVDALAAAKRFTGLISSFPVGDWLFGSAQVQLPGPGTPVVIHGLCAGDVNVSYLP